MQANVAGKDAALMLDFAGYASELNGTNIFMIRDDTVYTPHADSCLHGITRGMIIQLCREHSIEIIEKNISLTELYSADCVFCTGTMGELTPITEIDGRTIKGALHSQQFNQLTKLFEASIPKYCIQL